MTINSLTHRRQAGLALLAALTLAGLCVLTSAALALAGYYRLHGRHAPIPAQQVVGATAQVQRGRELVESFCNGCHQEDSPLMGDVDFGRGRGRGLSVGSFVSSNLTAAGRSSLWTDGELFRAIRNGVDADGRWLIVMSYTNTNRLSDQDVRAVIAYLRSRPAQGRSTPNPPDRLNPLGLILLGAGLLPRGNPVFTGVITSPPKGPTAQYGQYIVSYQNCRQCHGARLSNLMLVRHWKLEQFMATMRTGIDPDGNALPCHLSGRPVQPMDYEELAALYEYLTLPGDM